MVKVNNSILAISLYTKLFVLQEGKSISNRTYYGKCNVNNITKIH